MVVFIHSKYCPKCEIFKYGRLIRYTDEGRVEIYDRDQESGLNIIKDVCDIVGVPYSEIEVGVEREPDMLSGVEIRKGRIRDIYITPNINRVWISEMLGRTTIELPGILIKSKLTRDRYVSIEIITEPPAERPEALLISQYVAARQVLRNMARTAIEEKLIAYKGKTSIEEVEHLFNKLWHDVINEEGIKEPDVWKWSEGFIKLRTMKVRP